MLLAALFALSTSELRLELVRESLTGAHCRYREYVNGIATEDYRVVPCSGTEKPVTAAPSALRVVDGRLLRRSVVEERPLMPFAHDYDAATGALVRRVPLFFNAKSARVFDPNPVVALNDPSLQDTNDSALAVPDAAYREVELPDEALHGPWVTLVDRQPRNVAPPEGALRFNREEDGFEDVSAWFHLDRNQRYLQSLGYTGARGVVPYAIEVDAHATNGADNSFFLPSAIQTGRGALYFGEGGTDDAEDADLLVHEYMHAIIEWIAPGTFGGLFASESRALAEGMGDYWAFSAHEAARRTSGRDPFCFADWDARCWLDDPSQNCAYPVGTDCLRRLDSTRTMADFETSETAGVEHRNGAIWSSALRQIHDAIGREAADKILIESLFDAPSRPTYAVMAERLLEADRLLYRGAHAGVICSAMYTRGIVTQCDTTPRGERTIFQSGTFGAPIPDNNPAGVTSTITIDDPRTIENLYVRVDIAHPSRGDLFVELTAPDGTKIVLQDVSSSRARDIHSTFGLDAVPAEPLGTLIGRSAAGTWTLTVVDRFPRDEGSLLSWGLEIQFAGDAPATSRPMREPSQVIPVVAHVYGQDGAWVSEVRLANPLDESQTIAMVFTQSGESGLEQFAVQQVHLAPRQTLAFDDIVQRTFHTFGSGTLEVQGYVVVMSRMYLTTAAGTLSQNIPVDLDLVRRNGTPLVVAPFVQEGSRYNLGITELGGAEVLVRVAGEGWEEQLKVTAFGHAQIPVPAGLIEASVIDGDGAITVYLSQIDPGSDAMFVPGQKVVFRRVGCLPAITAQTSEAPEWRSDFWLASRRSGTVTVTGPMSGSGVEVPFPGSYEGVLARLFHRTFTTAVLCTTLPEGVFGFSRIVHGATTQAVPLLKDDDDPWRHLLFIENNDRYRTNVGIVATTTSIVTFVIYDSAGNEIERQRLWVDPGVHQVAVRAAVTNGHAIALREHGLGSVYASLIDRGTGDATFFPGW